MSMSINYLTIIAIGSTTFHVKLNNATMACVHFLLSDGG